MDDGTLRLSPFQRLMRWANNLILITLVPLDGPGRFMASLFRAPLLLSDLGLSAWIPGWILILTTSGRRSGRPHRTAMEYLRPGEGETLWVMSGWGGKTDWYRNARANPRVEVQTGRLRFAATALPLNEVETLQYLEEILRYNPMATAIFSRWAGREISSDPDSLRMALSAFPGLALESLEAAPQVTLDTSRSQSL